MTQHADSPGGPVRGAGENLNDFVRRRLDYLGTLPDRYHQIIVHGLSLNICRTVRADSRWGVAFVWRLSVDCDVHDIGIQFGQPGDREHLAFVEEVGPDDKSVVAKFVPALQDWLLQVKSTVRATDEARLLTLAEWFDGNPDEREPW